MKKTLSFVTTCALGALCTVAIAAPYFNTPTTAKAAEFFHSPTGGFAPEIKGFENENEDCTALLKLTPFEKRSYLSEDATETFEDAYDSLASETDVTEICEDLEGLLKELKLDTTQAAVSEIFNLSFDDCDGHDDHDESTVKLEINSVDTFVALLQYVDEEWVLVENVKVNKNKGTLTFDVTEFTPFAIVVDTSEFVKVEEPDADVEAAKQEIIKETGITAGISLAALMFLVKMFENN